MNISEFGQAVSEQHFELGEVFWLGDWEFEVVGKKNNPPCRTIRKVVCRWDVTEDEFLYAIDAMQDEYPEIEDAVVFYHEHKREIIDKYVSCFRAMISESETSHESVMRSAIESVFKKERM